MKLNNKSKYLMESLLDEYKNLKMKENIYLHKDNFYLKILNQLLEADESFKLNKNHIILTENENINNIGIKKSKYVPDSIIDYSSKNDYIKLTYKFIVSSKVYNIHFIIYERNNKKIKKIEKYIRKIYVWLYIIGQYSDSNCGNILDIYINLIDKEKKLPKEVKKTLSSEHINSAVTTSCTAIGDILIYREEEWFKVFIHETFHILGVDFSSMNCIVINKKMEKIFNINSEFNIYESYTEFWATILNSLLSSYFLVDKENITTIKKFQEKYLLYIDFFIEFERFFSLFQCVKVLNHIGLSYNNIIESKDSYKKSLYKEKTNIFAYYILKCVLLYNYNDFIKWCQENNKNTLFFVKTHINLSRLYEFIEKKYKKIIFLNDMKKTETIFKNKKSNKELYETLRMTIIEI